jgi:hypothetical protein
VTDVTPFSLVSYHHYDVLSEIFEDIRVLAFHAFSLCGFVDMEKLGQLCADVIEALARIRKTSCLVHAKDVLISCHGDLEKLHLLFSVVIIVSTRELWGGGR